MVLKTIQLNRKAGLDSRAINKLVQVTSQFESDIYLTYNGHKVNCKSIMGVLSLAIPNNAEISLEASGSDDQEALRQLVETIQTLT
ncbi:phosphocarrier protein HPr [Neobacillus niacini]|jgi:phosphocarrier protein HPr|uniref:HPr family phosphocarrier protein n=1 Tax=Neobacillus driksii TaxID=3035913 RepID=UPI002787958C|nr:HPr family phosphocarrier protein [Neobacillus niacini]MDQ0970874.1 phosphocarrier protein HPr [Neobacillus niacini]